VSLRDIATSLVVILGVTLAVALLLREPLEPSRIVHAVLIAAIVSFSMALIAKWKKTHG
jgi:hypothetical protein